MTILVQGKNNSGKSAYAEALIAGFGAPRYYIATMKPFGEDGARRVQKHRRQREGLGFVTLELPYKIGGADIPKNCCALVEDVSNLLANNMFEPGRRDVFEDITSLCARAANTVIVTISELEDGDYDDGTEAYINSLYELNARLADFADEVISL